MKPTGGQPLSGTAAQIQSSTANPPRRQSPINRALSALNRHPFFTGLAALVGVVGVALSVVQLALPSHNGGPALDVAALAIGMEPYQIDAVNGSSIPNDEGSDRPTRLDVSPIDITFKNTGGEPSIINKAEAELLYSTMLHDCTRSGAGPAQVTANYALTFPLVEEGEYSDLAPSTSADIDFVVPPGSVERMQLTVGPQEQSGNSYPTVLAVRIFLFHDDGSKLDVGTVAVAASTKQMEKQISEADDPECAAESLAELDQLYAVATVHSAELDVLT